MTAAVSTATGTHVPIERPWEDIPNPWGFPTLGEQLRQIRPSHSPFFAQIGNGQPITNAMRRKAVRTASAGTDKIGLGFSKGDLLLANSEIYIADEVVFDNPSGYPYDVHYSSPWGRDTFVLEKSTSRLFSQSFSNRGWMLQELDLDWVPPFLGLTFIDQSLRGLSDDFAMVCLQGFRVRARLLSDPAKGRKSFRQDQVAVVGRSVPTELFKLLIANRSPQYVGPVFEPAPHQKSAN